MDYNLTGMFPVNGYYDYFHFFVFVFTEKLSDEYPCIELFAHLSDYFFRSGIGEHV